MTKNQPGQAWVLQSWNSVSAPTQSAPPFCGVGLVHVRVRDWVPPSHVNEHVPHTVHADHPPSTETKR